MELETELRTIRRRLAELEGGRVTNKPHSNPDCGVMEASPHQTGMAGSPAARGPLLQRVRELRVKADRLEALSNALPVEISPAVGAAIFELLFPDNSIPF